MIARLETRSPAALLERIAYRFFPYPLDVDKELRKVDVARILTGLFALVRFAQIVQVNDVIGGPANLALVIPTFLSAVFVTVGLFTPISAVCLALLMRVCDGVFHTGTLGTTVFIQLLIVMVLVRAGSNYSIDSKLLFRSKFLQRIYVKPTASELKCAYAFVLIVYGTISAAALWFHVRDPYWIHGLTVKSMFTNSYLCKHSDFFRAIDRQWPAAFGVLSICSGIAQSIFQFLMLPLMAFKFGRIFVRWHGLAFFLISLLLLNLSFLPHFELLLWWIILFPSKLRAGETKQEDKWCGRCSLSALAMVFYSIYFVLMVAFVFTIHWLTASNDGPSTFPMLRQYAITIDRAAGIEVPIVFDNADLKMGNRWLLLYRKGPGDANWTLTPLTQPDGQKGNYLGHDVLWAGNHNSDLLYFGTTLQFRRRIIDMPLPQLFYFIDRGFGREAIEREITYDYRREHLSGEVRYKAMLYENAASEVSLFESSEPRLESRPILQRWYRFDGSALQ